MDEHYTIDTPENIEFRYTVAGIGSRFLAAIADIICLGLLQGLVWLVMIMLINALNTDTFASSAINSVMTAIGILLFFIIQWGYFIIFEMLWNGQSPGKRLVRLRVVREGGRPITFVASAIRNLVRFVDFMPVFYGVGVMVMFIDQRARRLGDLAGGTVVVKDRGEVSLDSLTSRATPLATAQYANQDATTLLLPNLHLITDNDYDVVQQFLRRRNELGHESRQRLGLQLAEGLRTRLNIADEGNHERFLEYLVYEYRMTRQATTNELRTE